MRQDMGKTRDPQNDLVVERLKKFREEAGLSQDEAAQFSGVPVDNLRRYERGASGVPADVLRELARIYGHAMDDFYAAVPPKADLANRPTYHLKTLPGMQLDEKTHKEVMAVIERANREVATKRKK